MPKGQSKNPRKALKNGRPRLNHTIHPVTKPEESSRSKYCGLYATKLPEILNAAKAIIADAGALGLRTGKLDDRPCRKKEPRSSLPPAAQPIPAAQMPASSLPARLEPATVDTARQISPVDSGYETSASQGSMPAAGNREVDKPVEGFLSEVMDLEAEGFSRIKPV